MAGRIVNSPRTNKGVSPERVRRVRILRFNSPMARTSVSGSAPDRLILLAIILSFFVQPIAVLAQRGPTVTVTIDASHVVHRFRPAHTLGGAIDGHDKGTNDQQLTPVNIQAMLSAGLASLTYRLRTELAGDVWHWNPQGSWSDEANKSGYWTSGSQAPAPISVSYGYTLPRRGNTIDQANDVGYSRIDDNDYQSFWKSNPYLDQRFTGEPNSSHPQWIVVEFEKPLLINAVRLVWGEPFATSFEVQYGDFDDVSDLALSPPGTWTIFPQGVVRNSQGRETVLPLAKKPIRARWLRVLMTESSNLTGAALGDVRDHLGFAMREIGAGTLDSGKNFHDVMRHAPDRRKQT